MADLSEKDSALTVKIVGASTAGVESNFAKVDSNGSAYSVLTGAGGAASGFAAAVTSNGELRVLPPPRSLLSDVFAGVTLDSQQWVSTSGNSGSVATSDGLTLSTGTTASAYASVSSIPSFTHAADVPISFSTTFQLESGLPRTALYRFVGISSGGSNTTANPHTNAVGFEWNTLGVLYAVIYSAGVIIYAQALAALTDGAWHSLSFVWSTTRCTFYVDTSDTPSAVASAKVPSVQVLPVRFLMINSSTPPGSPATFKVTSVGLGDTGHNGVTIRDPRYPWRGASVLPSGILPVDSGAHYYTHQGRSFTANSDAVSLPTTARTPLLLIRNPVGSGKTIKMKRYIFGAPTDGKENLRYSVYLNPTISSNGAAITAGGNKQTGQNAAVSLTTSSPIVTNNGTLLSMHNTTSASGDAVIAQDYAFFLEPNNSLLITAQTSKAPLSAYFSFDFVEDNN